MKTRYKTQKPRSASTLLVPSLVASLLCGTLAMTPLQADVRDDQIADLLKRIAALEKTVDRQSELLDGKIAVLEKKQAITDADATQVARTTPKLTAGPAGFGITSPDKAFDLRFKALAQFDSRFFFDDGVPNRDGFFLRRIRTILAGSVANTDFNITPELGANALSSTSSTVGLIDAWFNVKLDPAFNIKAGRFASPVTLEPGANRHFMESPFVNTLLPNRDIGAEANGTVASGYVDYRLGVFSGTRNNTQAFSTDESDGDKKVAGRITVAPFKKKEGALAGLSIGLGAGAANIRGSNNVGGANALQNISTNGQQTLLSFRNTTTGVGVIADGDQLQLSPSIEWYTGTPWSFVGEYAYEKQDYSRLTAAPAGSTVNTVANSFEGENSAWRATVGYVLTGEEATKTGVTPASPFNFSKGTWGAFELVARVSGIDLADELFTPGALGGGGLSETTNATRAFAYGLGLNWYLNRNLRILANAEKTEFEGGGLPNAANNNGVADDELYFFTRLQFSF